MNWKIWIFIGILIWGNTGCEVINPAEGIPAYIHVEPFTVNTFGGQGSNSAKITDVWLAVDDQIIGAFYLPATIPLLNEGTSNITLFPGIVENGISATREIYPYYKRMTLTLDLQPGVTDTIFPVTSYVDDLEYVFVEDFEGSNLFGEDLDGNAATSISLEGEEVFEGTTSARMTLLDDDALLIQATEILYQLPTAGTDIWLELDYKCEIDFSIGVIGVNGQVSDGITKVTLKARPTWNKVYISLDQEVATLNAPLYKIYFRASKSNDLEEANIYVDNVKLIHQ